MTRDDYPVGLLVGLGIACSVAISALLLLLTRRGQQLSGPINIWNVGAGAALPTPAQAEQLQLGARATQLSPISPPVFARPPAESKLDTYAIGLNPVRVMSAGEHYWKVQMRNVGPPGSICYVATDPTALSFSSMSIAIPAGGQSELRVAPRGGLFAVGTVSNIQLSVSASEELFSTVPGE